MIALLVGLRTPTHSIEKPVPWTGVPGVMTHSLSALERLPEHWIKERSRRKRKWEQWGKKGVDKGRIMPARRVTEEEKNE